VVVLNVNGDEVMDGVDCWIDLNSDESRFWRWSRVNFGHDLKTVETWTDEKNSIAQTAWELAYKHCFARYVRPYRKHTDMKLTIIPCDMFFLRGKGLRVVKALSQKFYGDNWLTLLLVAAPKCPHLYFSSVI
jgi:hypothetical protein